MADQALGSGITAGGDLLGGIFGSIGQGQQNKRQASAAAQSASTINDVIQNQILPSDTKGLEAQAIRSLAENSNVANAQLAQRGIYDSGVANATHRDITSATMSDLAEAINADQLARGSAALQGYSSPAFGFFDPQSGSPTNQGK